MFELAVEHVLQPLLSAIFGVLRHTTKNCFTPQSQSLPCNDVTTILYLDFYTAKDNKTIS